MSDYDNQIQATAKFNDLKARQNAQNGGEARSSVAQGSDIRKHDWADVLKELEPYY